MPKEIRFSQLVQKAGRPETVPLWTKAKDNPSFMKAVNENRVMTVFQNPTGTKKDFGTIGFKQQKFASYLVFPKRLPDFRDSHVIGIKYELLQESAEKLPVKKEIAPPKTVAQNVNHDSLAVKSNGAHKLRLQGGSLKNFQVKIVRTGLLETTITVDARNMSEAERKALEAVKNQNFKPEDIHDEVKSITQT